MPSAFLFIVVGLALLVLAFCIVTFGKDNPGFMVTIGMYVFTIAWIIMGIVLILRSFGGKKLSEIADDADRGAPILPDGGGAEVVPQQADPYGQQAGTGYVYGRTGADPVPNRTGGRILLIIGIICVFCGIFTLVLINTLLGFSV